MKHINRRMALLVMLSLLLFTFGAEARDGTVRFAEPAAAQGGRTTTVTGTLNWLWVDPVMPRGGAAVRRLSIADETAPNRWVFVEVDSRATRLPEGLGTLRGQRVTATIDDTTPSRVGTARPPARLLTLQRTPGSGRGPGIGLAQVRRISTTWLTILCRFNGDANEPVTPTRMDAIVGDTLNQGPSLNNYWRETSYDHINLDDSTATGWYELPRTNNTSCV